MNKNLKALLVFILCFAVLFLIIKFTYRIPKELQNINIINQFKEINKIIDGIKDSKNQQVPDYDFTEALKVLEGMRDKND